MEIKERASKRRNELLAELTVKNLKSRGFDAYYCGSSGEAVELAMSLIPRPSTVSWGGSVTIEETGLLDAVKGNKDIAKLDRDSAATERERIDIMRRALLCDVFLTSVNAVSEDGVLVNIDGVGNRVAAMTFGPEAVIVMAGMNKVCKTQDDALTRAQTVAAPLNMHRVLSRQSRRTTPCAVTGTCADCKSEECICAFIEITRFCRIPGRIKVILVGEALGL